MQVSTATKLAHVEGAGAVNVRSRSKPRGDQVPSTFRGGKCMKLVGQWHFICVTICGCYVRRDHDDMPDTRCHWLSVEGGFSAYGSGATPSGRPLRALPLSLACLRNKPTLDW
ncbi:hypothetical protein P171DRAFT_107401 [Karstenula rhodostoma CBS 690.94]|uniref:Uncharacterized protein n=1 Tax=Karstenula rhodostoma CBS 690.94 TaxID=1392251 RepID=A0A9P4P993_9PLEO|nr:hypothetical protein P171DRAFT_107401 [Karstenula rhodostoma CBS 690.94]